MTKEKLEELLGALREVAAIGEAGVIERRETGKPTWCALDEIKDIANAAIAKAKEGIGERTPGADVAKELMSHVNDYGFDLGGFIEYMSREHRTLQQNLTRLCAAWLRHCAGLKEGQYDGRNEASVRLGKAMMDRCYTEMHVPFI